MMQCIHGVSGFDTAVVSVVCNWIALCCGMLLRKQRIYLQRSFASERLEAAYRECLQDLSSIGKNFCSERFQMFLVYGAVYLSDVPLVSKRSCYIENFF